MWRRGQDAKYNIYFIGAINDLSLILGIVEDSYIFGRRDID